MLSLKLCVFLATPIKSAASIIAAHSVPIGALKTSPFQQFKKHFKMSWPEKMTWVSASGGKSPNDAIHAGVDTGNKVFVARAHHEGIVIPGKLHMSHSNVYIPYDGKEVAVGDYEVLCGPPATLSWVDCSGSNIPPHAVNGGQEAGGQTLYIGRVIHKGTVTVGKVHPDHGTCYVAYDGEELGFSDYEILVKNKLGLFLGV